MSIKQKLYPSVRIAAMFFFSHLQPPQRRRHKGTATLAPTQRSLRQFLDKNHLLVWIVPIHLWCLHNCYCNLNLIEQDLKIFLQSTFIADLDTSMCIQNPMEKHQHSQEFCPKRQLRAETWSKCIVLVDIPALCTAIWRKYETIAREIQLILAIQNDQTGGGEWPNRRRKVFWRLWQHLWVKFTFRCDF